jgi:hypothetical protein
LPAFLPLRRLRATQGYSPWFTAPFDFTPDLETTSGAPAEVLTTFVDIKPRKTGVTLQPGETICAAHPELVLVRERQQGWETMGLVRPGWYRIRQANSVSPYDGKTPENAVPAGTRPQSDWVAFEVVENPPKEKPIQWGGERAADGFQLGARIVPDRSTFQTGDVVKFQAFGRNLSGQDLSLVIGNYWKVNYTVQIQTDDGKPVYMQRDARNQAKIVAGYLQYTLGKGAALEISGAALKIAREPQRRKSETVYVDEDSWVEAVPLKPGRYRVRLLSWGVARVGETSGGEDGAVASGWIPIEVKSE